MLGIPIYIPTAYMYENEDEKKEYYTGQAGARAEREGCCA